MPEPGDEPVRRIAAVGLLTLAAVMLRVHGIGREGLWADEATSVTLAVLSWGDLWDVLVTQRANMGLYMAALKLWIPFTGSETGVRMLSVVFAALSVPAMEKLGRRLFSPQAGMAGALLLVLHGFHVAYSQEARAYTMVVWMVIVATWLFVEMLESPRRAAWAGYVAVSVLAPYAQFVALFVTVAHLLSLAIGGTAAAWRRAVLAVAAILAGLAPLVYVMARHDLSQLSWIEPLDAGQVRGVAFWLGGFHVTSVVSLGAAVAVALWFAARPSAPVMLRRAFVWLGFPLLLALAVSLVSPMLVPRYLIVVLPFLLLIAAHAAVSIPARGARAIAVAILAVSLVPGLLTVWKRSTKPDWRPVVRLVLGNARAGDVLFFPAGGSRSWSYYMRESPVPAPAVLFPVDTGRWAQRLVAGEADFARMKDHGRIWLIELQRDWDGRRRSGARESLAGSHRLVRQWRFRQLRVGLFERR